MYPYVLENWVGEWALIPTYGLALALAFSLGYLESLRRAISRNEDPKHVERVFLIIVVSSLGGARLFHVMFEGFAYYRENPKEALAFWEGGFTFYGGLLASLASIYAYCRYCKISFFRMLDTLTPGTFIGLFIGRLGCFAAGCCWGKPSALAWAVSYTHRHTLAGLRFTPTHPSQVYESLACLGIFVYVSRLARQKKPEGTVFLHGLIAYAVARFLVEFTRGDQYRGFVLGDWLSVAQFLSLILIIPAIAALTLQSRNASETKIEN